MADNASLTYWRLTGLAATAVIVLAMPAYLVRVQLEGGIGSPARAPATFVSSERCRECHAKEYARWQHSDHDHAMEVATQDTVLGDFDDAVIESDGVTSRFYRKGPKFFVHTQGPGGAMGDFEITHTLGWRPLQQYLIPFAGGRLQCLPIAWDVQAKRWYHLYAARALAPDDWLYWTNAGQNWNGMCAECHSTNLKKGFDPGSRSYRTTWSDIDVGCEACHGPGSHHVAWAELPDMARPVSPNCELLVDTSEISARNLVEICAPCHSHRAALGDYTHSEPDLLDTLLPTLLTDPFYFADGQIREEVYVYGSFVQSRMYARGVKCSDCHDVHSTQLLNKGNDLCLQCHRAGAYDTRAHHFHKSADEAGTALTLADGTQIAVGAGAACVACHMPERTYMGIDGRRDHSLRVARPDFGASLDTPDACTACHVDQTSSWADAYVTRWHGPGRPHHYGTTLAAPRNALPDAVQQLGQIADDPLYPVIVRATALRMLVPYPATQTQTVFERALSDPEALIRRTAVEGVSASGPELLSTRLAAMLHDPVKAVRIEAARRLATQPGSHAIPNAHRAAYDAALLEYVAAMDYSADFAFARYNLGNLHAAQGRLDQAMQSYRAAIDIDNRFAPAQLNLATLAHQHGDSAQAEQLLRQALQHNPQLYDAALALGLLLAELGQLEPALKNLQTACRGMPEHAAAHYNSGLLLQQLERLAEAEAMLRRALELEPSSKHYHALVDHYLRRRQRGPAEQLVEQWLARYPDDGLAQELRRRVQALPR